MDAVHKTGGRHLSLRTGRESRLPSTSHLSFSLRTALAWLASHPWVLLPLLALPAVWPFLTCGIPRSSDGENHLLRLGLLDSSIQHGIFYPRWMPEMLLGYGYPRFSYYAPAAYYFVEVLHLLGLSLYAAFILAFVAGLLLAGLGMYRLAVDVFAARSRFPALVAGAAYMFAPYLLIDTFIRGDFAEVIALGILPWALWVARRILRDGRPQRYLVPLAIIVGGLAISHPLVLMLAIPVLASYMMLHWGLRRFRARSAAWAAGGVIAAMGISAFYWAPVLFERSFLSGAGYEIALAAWLPDSAWRLNNFLDTGLKYSHTSSWPVIRLGLIQVVLAAAGVVLARRRDAEWLYFVAVALMCCALSSAWALPLWQSTEVLTSIQFTWRLLTILSLPLALFAGGILLSFHSRLGELAAAALLIGLILVTQAPRVEGMDYFARETVDLSPSVLAQWELERDVLTGAEGDTSLQEFRPRWADRTLQLEKSDPAPTASNLEADLLRGNALDLEMRVSSDGGPLRFTSFYYPGWQALLDDRALPTYPSTNLGLLTVDLPAGVHELSVAWIGTVLQRWAGFISLACLAALALAAGRISHQPKQALISLAVFVGIIILLGPRPQYAVSAPAKPIESSGVQLLGYRAEQQGEHIYLYPYWLVERTPSESWETRWELRDSTGRTAIETTPQAWFNTSPASNWAPGTIVDDAERLTIPSGFRTGEARLAVAVAPGAPATEVGVVAVDEPTAPAEAPRNIASARFGDAFQLDGYDLAGAQAVRSSSSGPAVARPGDTLYYTLYWRASKTPSENVHSFLHLVDSLGRPLAQEDHLPGPNFHPPRLWDPYLLQPDIFRLSLPDDAPGGLYWPSVGLYDRDVQRLTAQPSNDEAASDHLLLEPIKVLGRERRPAVRASARFGELADLVGYDLETSPGGLAPGAAITINLHLRVREPTTADYTRCLHLRSSEAGMAAQYDSPPQDGINPTSSWLPGEWITDTAVLQISADAPPGAYTVFLGFYDSTRGGERLPVWDAKGDPVPDALAPLVSVEVR